MNQEIDIYIPTLHTLAMENIFTGSWKSLRFRIKPNVTMVNGKEVDFANSSILVEYWHGLLCYEKSQMEGEQSFPLSEDGRLQLKAWLESKV